MKKVGALAAVYTVFCLMLAGLAIWVVIVGRTYGGREVTFSTDDRNQLTIEADSVTLEVSSCGYFSLRHPRSGKVISGVWADKPLGWPCRERYTYEPEKVPGGFWIVEKGDDITVLVSSLNNISVQEVLKPDLKVFLIFLIIMLVGCLWLLGCAVASG